MSYVTTVLAGSPAAYYRCGEWSGRVLNDASGNNNTITLPTPISLSPYITRSFSGPLRANRSRPGALIGDQNRAIILLQPLSLPSGVNLGAWSALSFEVWHNAGSGWKYVAVVCTSVATVLYQCGLGGPVTSTSGAPILPTTISSLFSYAGVGASDVVDELALYDYALTQTQVENHVSAAGYIPASVSATFSGATPATGTAFVRSVSFLNTPVTLSVATCYDAQGNVFSGAPLRVAVAVTAPNAGGVFTTLYTTDNGGVLVSGGTYTVIYPTPPAYYTASETWSFFSGGVSVLTCNVQNVITP